MAIRRTVSTTHGTAPHAAAGVHPVRSHRPLFISRRLPSIGRVFSATVTWACCSLFVGLGCDRGGAARGPQAAWGAAMEGRAAAASGVPDLAADRFFKARRAAATNVPDEPTLALAAYRRIRDFGLLEAAAWCAAEQYGHAALALQATIVDLGGEGAEDAAERPVDLLHLLVQVCRDLAGDPVDLPAAWRRFLAADPQHSLAQCRAVLDDALAPYHAETYARGLSASGMAGVLHRLDRLATTTSPGATP